MHGAKQQGTPSLLQSWMAQGSSTTIQADNRPLYDPQHAGLEDRIQELQLQGYVGFQSDFKGRLGRPGNMWQGWNSFMSICHKLQSFGKWEPH